MWRLASAVLVSAFLAVLAAAQSPQQHILAIDAGSTGSRIYIYQFAPRVSDGTHVPESFPTPFGVSRHDFSKRSNISLGSFVDNPSGAGDSLAVLIDFAKDRLGDYTDDWSTIPIVLGATAGMRVLPSDARNSIMASVRTFLADKRKCPFSFTNSEQARILAGEEEGVYGWLTVNFLLNTLQPGAETHGALDLGGASTQITFKPQSEILSNAFSTSIGTSDTHVVYTHSYLYYGINEATNQVVQNQVDNSQPDADGAYDFPCWPVGYTGTHTVLGVDYKLKGTSHGEACRQLVSTIIDKSRCSNFTAQPCGFNGVYQPGISGHFFAFSGFFYTISDLRLSENTSLAQVRSAGDTLCAYNYTELLQHLSDPAFALSRCISAMYTYDLLVTGYGFDPAATSITFTDNVQGTSVGWTLGYVLFFTNLLPWELQIDTREKFKTLSVVLSIFVAGLTAIAMVLGIKLRNLTKRQRRLSGGVEAVDGGYSAL